VESGLRARQSPLQVAAGPAWLAQRPPAQLSRLQVAAELPWREQPSVAGAEQGSRAQQWQSAVEAEQQSEAQR